MLLGGEYGGRWAVLLLAHSINLTAQPSFVRCVAVGVMAGVMSCLACYLAGGTSACISMQRLETSAGLVGRVVTCHSSSCCAGVCICAVVPCSSALSGKCSRWYVDCAISQVLLDHRAVVLGVAVFVAACSVCFCAALGDKV